MRTSRKLAIVVIVAVLLSPIVVSCAQSATVDDAQNSVNDAYNALVAAYNAGADVSNLIIQINQAINLTSQAQALTSSDPQQAQSLASEAQTLAQNVTAQATAAKQNGLTITPIITIVSAATAVFVGCIVYFFGPKFFWGIWLKLRGNYHVKAKETPKKTSAFIITWEQICAIILALAVIIALVATVPLFLPKNTSEQFSELGILGPTMQLGDYPSQGVVGQTLSLYVYVGNQMGQPMYYNVMVKMGDNNTAINPAPITETEQFGNVVPYNGTWTFPVNVTLTQAGLNQRIIFELWIYNQTLQQMQYNQRWGQIWLNVTSPMG